MALVILPCDMPWWGILQNHIRKLAAAQNVDELISGMQTIYTMCNVGLDPDEPDVPDATVLNGLREFLEGELTEAQRKLFLSLTLATIADAALALRTAKPVMGLPFSLQQEVSEIEVSHEFACSLLAHAFLSSYPKRTNKTHPTLQDFNFSNFFPFLKQKFQKAKLRSILHYFDVYAEARQNVIEPIKISRQVMKGTDWLTIEDWLECTLPLCHLSIKHDNRMENAEHEEAMFVCFSSKKPGGRVLSDGSSRECVQFVTSPELLVTLLCVEALEDNEVVIVENVIQVGKISNIRLKPDFEPRRANTNTLTVCLMDAENYTRLPLSQYEEDNVLRELNKALLGFRQKQQQRMTHSCRHQPVARRLSPIGESFSPTPTENGTSAAKNQLNKRRENMKKFGNHLPKGKFIVLGSSGELLPVSRNTVGLPSTNDYVTCASQDSSPDEFYSARTSLPDCDGSDEEENARRYSVHLDTPENRNSFADRLREALNRAQSSASTDSSYAVDISVAGSSIADPNTSIRMKRGGSRGFMLEEDSFDVTQAESTNHTSEQEIRKNSFKNTSDDRERNKGGSSKYSFSTDYNSELEEVYDQLSRWLDESEERQSSEESCQQQKLRDSVIIQFAGSLLKRTLSESFVGVPLSEGADCVEEVPDEGTRASKENLKLKLAARSLSLELAKHKHKLAAQLISVIGNRHYASSGGQAPVVTGNWGCGSQNLGDPQLKLLVQWLAASVSGLPHLIYYTCNHHKLLKLDTVCRVLVDRQWNVGELVRAVIHYTQFTLGQADNAIMNNDCDTLFDLLINSDEKSRIILSACAENNGGINEKLREKVKIASAQESMAAILFEGTSQISGE